MIDTLHRRLAPTQAVIASEAPSVPNATPSAALVAPAPLAQSEPLPTRTTIAAGPAARRKKKLDAARKAAETVLPLPTPEHPVDLDAEELAGISVSQFPLQERACSSLLVSLYQFVSLFMLAYVSIPRT